MNHFLKRIFVFALFTILVGEVVLRFSHTLSDIPQRTIDKDGIQKYFPNQEGYWKGGGHKWKINSLGWPGELPTNYNNLITIIGDSFIENFMNPNECHQSILLKQRMAAFNFLEASRSGVSLIEAMEIAKQLDSLNPRCQLIYVSDSDFYESISNIKVLGDITQVDIKSKKLLQGKMKSPGFKKILYNWKLLYYFYNRFPVSDFIFFKGKQEKKEVAKSPKKPSFESEVLKLIEYMKENYEINDKILVFHPKSSIKIIEVCKEAGFSTIILDSSNDKSWTFDHDRHWTCYGHNAVADQIYKNLSESHLLTN